MLEVPRRPTMQEIQARRNSSATENRLSKRLGMSLPNLGDDQTLSFQRNMLLTRTILPDPGETAEEVQTKQRYKLSSYRQNSLEKIKPLSVSLPLLLSPHLPPHIFSFPVISLCLLALRCTPKPVKVFKLPDFPATLSVHSVQSYYSELIHQLGKAIFSAQNEDPALLARYFSFLILSGTTLSYLLLYLYFNSYRSMLVLTSGT